jgi:replicative DNA helicase
MLTRADFFREANAEIFDAMCAIARAGTAVDIVTVRDEMARRGKLDTCGGTEYLKSLDDYMPTAANLPHHAAIVAEKSYYRRLIEVSAKIKGLAYGEEMPASEIAAQVEQAIFSARDKDSRSRKTWRDMRSLTDNRLDAIFARREAGPTAGVGVPTGLTRLDEIVTLEDGTYVILGGRPSMGKTACALTVAYNVAARGGVVGFFSQEMTAEKLTDRLISMRSGIDGYKIRKSWLLTDEETRRVAAAAADIWMLPLKIDDTTSLCPSEMRARSRRLRAEHDGLDLIFVDYLQIVGSDQNRMQEGRRIEIGQTSADLKAMAKEMRCPLIALSQLTRSVEKRDDKRPMLSDLMESGDIEANADVVAFLYRASYYEPKKEAEEGSAPAGIRPEEVEIIVAKQRDGPTGTVKAGFFNHLTKFVNLAEDEPDTARF